MPLPASPRRYQQKAKLIFGLSPLMINWFSLLPARAFSFRFRRKLGPRDKPQQLEQFDGLGWIIHSTGNAMRWWIEYSFVEGSNKHYATKKLISNLASFIMVNPLLSTLQLQVPRIALTQLLALRCHFLHLAPSSEKKGNKVINERWMFIQARNFFSDALGSDAPPNGAHVLFPEIVGSENLKNAGQKHNNWAFNEQTMFRVRGE